MLADVLEVVVPAAVALEDLVAAAAHAALGRVAIDDAAALVDRGGQAGGGALARPRIAAATAIVVRRATTTLLALLEGVGVQAPQVLLEEVLAVEVVGAAAAALPAPAGLAGAGVHVAAPERQLQVRAVDVPLPFVLGPECRGAAVPGEEAGEGLLVLLLQMGAARAVSSAVRRWERVGSLPPFLRGREGELWMVEAFVWLRDVLQGAG